MRRRKAGALQKDSLYEAVSLNEIALKDDDAKSLATKTRLKKASCRIETISSGRLDSVEDKERR